MDTIISCSKCVQVDGRYDVTETYMPSANYLQSTDICRQSVPNSKKIIVTQAFHTFPNLWCSPRSKIQYYDPLECAQTVPRTVRTAIINMNRCLRNVHYLQYHLEPYLQQLSFVTRILHWVKTRKYDKEKSSLLLQNQNCLTYIFEVELSLKVL